MKRLKNGDRRQRTLKARGTMSMRHHQIDTRDNAAYTRIAAKVTVTRAAARQYDGLPRLIQGRVLKVFERLERWPQVSGAKPLTGRLAGHYRVRTGDYRVQFHARGERVVVEKIGHRDGFYEP